jgi:predicted ATPase
VVIGKNGAGKSTLFDAFGFLADSLTIGVEAACDSGAARWFRAVAIPRRT